MDEAARAAQGAMVACFFIGICFGFFVVMLSPPRRWWQAMLLMMTCGIIAGGIGAYLVGWG